MKMRTKEVEVKSYDEHETHIAEHTAFLLSGEFSSEVEKRICAHIDMHKNKLKEAENG